MPYIELENRRFFYAGKQGKGKISLLFCHGSGGGHHHWVYQLKGLAGKAGPLAFDLPGHGRSEGSTAADVSEYRRWLHDFADKADLAPFVLGGHSLGGAITLDYALHYPDQLLGMILVGTGARLKVLPSFLETLRQGTVPDAMSGYLYGPGVSEDLLKRGREEIEATAASVFYEDLSACDRFDLIDELPGISVPALVICGSEDLLTPVKYSRYLVEKLPRARLEIIEGAGHMVMVEEPDLVNRAVGSFLEELEE